jgi:hypothetical protein
VIDARTTDRRRAIRLWTLDHDDVAKLVAARRHRRAQGTGRLHDPFPLVLVHASTSNLSPWNRVAVY